MLNNLFEHHHITSDQTIKTQVCVIGSGCGGASVAKKLTDEGLDVVILEQGGYYHNGTFDQRELNMAAKISAEHNFATSHDGGNLLVYGQNVGGASVHYWADSYRTPQDKLDEWANKYGMQGHSADDLNPTWDEIERNLSIHEATDDKRNRMNQLLHDGSKKLGWHGHRVPQARKHCQKSGHCMQGCLYNAKQSQMVTHIPMALKQGARLYADARAEQFDIQNGEVKSLSVSMIDRTTGRPNGIKLKVVADKFVVAAGGFSSSFFLMQQGLQQQLPMLGKHFSMNPSTMVYGLYDEDIVLWRNIPAAYGIDEWRIARHENGEYQEGGYLLMPNQIQPALLAALLPGFGDVHQEVMQSLPRVGGTIAWMDDNMDEEHGEIQLTDGGGRKVFYEYGPTTQKILKDSIVKQCEMLFATGAKKLIVASHKPAVLETMEDVHQHLETIPVAAGGLMMASPHPGGGCRMGDDPATSVVGHDHRVHGFENLYVSDSSVFPTSSSVDPSLTIMGFSYIAAKHIAQSFNNG